MTPIEIRGARVHNLQSVDLCFQPGSLVVLQGPSGSGKSSLALDVLHAESRRRLLEVLQGPGGSSQILPRIPVDHILGLPPTVAVAPEDGTRPNASVAEMVGAGAILRDWFARSGTLFCPEDGQALRCWTPRSVVTALADLPVGTRLTIGAPLPRPADPKRVLDELRRSGFARIRLGSRLVRLDDVDTVPQGIAIELIVDRIKWSPEREQRLQEAIDTAWKAGSGVVRVDTGPDQPTRVFTETRISRSGRRWPTPKPEHFDRSSSLAVCPECTGDGCPACDHTGWGAAARFTRVGDTTLPQLLNQPLGTLELPGDDEAARALREVLCSLTKLGLGYLTLGQNQRTLGRGEWRRLALARGLQLAVPPRAIIVDEPLSGLDTESAERVCTTLRSCAAQGVTVVAIEHRPELLQHADRFVRFGPGAGPDGGRVVDDGPALGTAGWPGAQSRQPQASPTWTALHPHATGSLALHSNTWTVLTGPSGSGTTSLAVGSLAAHFAQRILPKGARVTGPEVRLIEPSVLVGASNPRSCVITATGIWAHLRTLFAATREARTRGLGPEVFSFNRAAGWCSACEGLGQHILRFGSLAPVAETCSVCDGGRLRPDLEDIRWRGHSARALLQANVARARELFAANPRLSPTLDALVATGLGHLPLGRPASSLSSGERRRFSVALAIARLRAAQRDPRPTLVVLDQPDAGLDDETASVVATWLADAIAGKGTLLTVAHHPALLAAADAVQVLPPRGDAVHASAKASSITS